MLVEKKTLLNSLENWAKEFEKKKIKLVWEEACKNGNCNFDRALIVVSILNAYILMKRSLFSLRENYEKCVA